MHLNMATSCLVFDFFTRRRQCSHTLANKLILRGEKLEPGSFIVLCMGPGGGKVHLEKYPWVFNNDLIAVCLNREVQLSL